MKLIAGILFFIVTLAHAESLQLRPASASEFVGYWRIILIPNELHKSQFKNEDMGYSDACQFFVQKPDGTWRNVTVTNMAGGQETMHKCPSNKADFELFLASLGSSPSPYKWIPVPNQNGLFLIGDPISKQSLIWKADYVLKDISSSQNIGTDLKKGDLFMQLMKRLNDSSITSAWPMILRPLQDETHP